jgi:predicted ferric reductase
VEPSTGAEAPHRQSPTYGLRPSLLLTAYAAILLAPLVIARMLGYPPRTFRDELSSALAMVAFSGLLVEFVLSGRFQTISGRIGIDVTMRFHQLMARSLAAFILVHPFLYETGAQSYPRPDDVTRQLTLGLSLANVASGITAWIALFVLIGLAIFRNSLHWSYEAWRLSHGIAAVIVAVFGFHHTLSAGRYSETAVLSVFWLGHLMIALFTIVWVYLITPLRQLRHPYRVSSIRPVAHKTWELAVEPSRGDPLRFEPGQFVWLTLDRSPFAITEHPFSISSSPAMRPRIEFLIKEAGDFTNRIGDVPVGASAYVDGPHGALTLAGRDGAGIAFIAGGVGLAPLLSILRQLAVESDRRPMKLIYGNRSEHQIAYRQELSALQGKLNLQIELVLAEPPDGWTGRTGRLDRATLVACLSDLADEDRRSWLYFVCGPAPLIDSVERDLVLLGIPLRQIVTEKFSYD